MCVCVCVCMCVCVCVCVCIYCCGCVGWFGIMGIDLPDRNNIYKQAHIISQRKGVLDY